MVKNLPASARDSGHMGMIPGLGRSPGVGNGNPLQYSFLQNPRTEEPGEVLSMGQKMVRHDWTHTHTTLMKEIKDVTNRWRNRYCSRIRRITIVKRSLLPKAIYRCNPYQATNGIFHRTRTNNFTIYMEIQKNLE